MQTTSYRVLLFCGGEHRDPTTSYWFGLHFKKLGKRKTSAWYNLKESYLTTSNLWETPATGNISAMCVSITNEKFREQSCSEDFCYICKTLMGKFYANYLLRRCICILFTNVH